MPKYSHRTLECSITLKDELRQVDLENYAKAYRKYDRESQIENRGAVVRAAFEAGWIVEPEEFDTDNADPRVVRWMANKINARFSEITEIPPEA